MHRRRQPLHNQFKPVCRPDQDSLGVDIRIAEVRAAVPTTAQVRTLIARAVVEFLIRQRISGISSDLRRVKALNHHRRNPTHELTWQSINVSITCPTSASVRRPGKFQRYGLIRQSLEFSCLNGRRSYRPHCSFEPFDSHSTAICALNPSADNQGTWRQCNCLGGEPISTLATIAADGVQPSLELVDRSRELCARRRGSL